MKKLVTASLCIFACLPRARAIAERPQVAVAVDSVASQSPIPAETADFRLTSEWAEEGFLSFSASDAAYPDQVTDVTFSRLDSTVDGSAVISLAVYDAAATGEPSIEITDLRFLTSEGSQDVIGIGWEGWLSEAGGDSVLVEGTLAVFPAPADGLADVRFMAGDWTLEMRMGQDQADQLLALGGLELASTGGNKARAKYCGCNNKKTLCAKNSDCDEPKACPGTPGKNCKWFFGYEVQDGPGGGQPIGEGLGEDTPSGGEGPPGTG